MPTQRSRAREIARRTAWSVRSRALVDRSDDERDCVVLLGSPRSGTTWLAEVIDRHHDHRLIFEPFRPGEVPELAGFADGQYLRPDERDPRFLEPVRDLLRGRIRNSWADHLNKVRVAERRVIKEIRGNLLAPWVVTQFPSVPVVLLIRHPLAVAVSRRQLGWKEHLDTHLRQSDLVEGHLGEVVEHLRDLDDPWRRTIAQWAIENIVPLRMTTPDTLCVVSYEQLILDPEPAVAHVLAAVGQSVDASVTEALNRPSRLVRADSAISAGTDLTASHRRHLSRDDESAAHEVLGWFGLDAVFAEGGDQADVVELSRLHAAPFTVG